MPMEAHQTSRDFDLAEWIAAGLRHGAQCVFAPRAANQWRSENSKVTSLPAFDFRSLFGDLPTQNIACSLVSISGPSSEPLHFHTSHVIGVATNGHGMLRHRKLGSKEEHVMQVREGDVALIPRNVLHLFETPEGGLFEYIAFEISDEDIDYQKHWTEAEA